MGVENVKIEPCDLYVGVDTYQVQKITCVADVASSLNNKYFIIYANSAQFLVWYNVGASGVDPAIAGYTSYPVAISANATASAVATATELVIEAIAGLDSTVSGNVITVTAIIYGYDIPAHDSQVAKTGFAFDLVTTGDKFEKLGLIEGDISVGGLSRSPVEIKSHQSGTTAIAAIMAGSGNPEISVELKEVVYSTYNKILRYGSGAYKPVAANSTAVIGGGTAGLFGSPEFVQVVLHPVRLGIADKTLDICFWKTTVDLESQTISGEKPASLPIKMKAYNDSTKHPAVSTWMVGDWSQSVVA